MHFTMPKTIEKPDEFKTHFMRIPAFAFELWRFCDVEANRYALTAVLFERKKLGECYAVATDGRQLARYKFFDDHDGENWSVLIPATTCREVSDSILLKEEVDFKQLTETEGRLSVDDYNRITLIQGRFPRYQDIFDGVQSGEHGAKKLLFGPALIHRAMSVFEKYNKLIDREAVKINVPPDDSCVKMESVDGLLEIIQGQMSND